MSKKTNILCEIELSATVTVIQNEEPPCECAIHKETPTDIAQYRCTCPVHQEMYQFHLLSSSSSSSLSVVPFFSLGMCGRPLRELTFLQMRLKKNENWYKTNYIQTCMYMYRYNRGNFQFFTHSLQLCLYTIFIRIL